MSRRGTAFQDDRCVARLTDPNAINIVDVNVCSGSAGLSDDALTSRKQLFQTATARDMICMNVCVHYLGSKTSREREKEIDGSTCISKVEIQFFDQFGIALYSVDDGIDEQSFTGG